MNPLDLARGPWVPVDGAGADLHVWLLGRFARLNRVLRGVSFADRCRETGLRPGQLRMAESGRAMTPATAEALLARLPHDRALFSRRTVTPFAHTAKDVQRAHRIGRVAMVNELSALVHDEAP